MKNSIIRLSYENLRNETHVEYNETVDGLVIKYGAETLGIQPQYSAYKSALNVEVSVLDVIRKSGYTGEISVQDHVRDGIFRGLDDAVQSVRHHFNADKRKSADKVNIVLKNYGNIAAKAFDQETAAIDDLLRELYDHYEPDIVLLGLNDWLMQLDTENRTFKRLMSERYAEVARRPATRMKAARAETDRTLRTMLDLVDALVKVNGAEEYRPFLNELNAVSERYKNQLAQAAGRKQKPVDENE
jgi:N12 class adenine-specific DNA methylase